MNTNIVDPNKMKNSRINKDSPIFILDNHLMPRPTPDIADRVEAPMTTSSDKIMAVLVGAPSAFIIQFAPVMLNIPDENCDTP